MAAAEQIEQAHEETAPMPVLNLWQKLVEIRKTVPALQKDGKSNYGEKYAYVSSNQVLTPIRAAMDALGVLLVPSVTGTRTVNKHENEGEKQHFTELDMAFTWVNADNPDERIECGWYAQGLDTGEKGPGKAYTYGEKTFMLKFFNIATDGDDPDQGSPYNDNAGAGRQQQRQQAPPQQQAPPAPASPIVPDEYEGPGPHNAAGWTQLNPPSPEQLLAWWRPFGLTKMHGASVSAWAGIEDGKMIDAFSPFDCWAWFEQARWRLRLGEDGTTWQLHG